MRPIEAPKRGGVEFKDDRLQAEGSTESLRSMAARAGWAEQGGRLLRDPDGVVIGRTKWMPNEPWFAEMQRDKSTRMKPQDLRDAVEKVLRGEKVTPQQHRAVKYLLDENDRITKSFAKIEEEHGQIPHFQDDVLDSLHVTDLPASHENLADLSLIDKARAIDEDAFQRIPDQVDDAAFMTAVREIINAEKSKTQEVAPGQSGAETLGAEAAAAGAADPLSAAGAAVYNPAAPAIKPRKRASVIGGRAHKAAIAAQEKFKALDRKAAAVENPDDYFALSTKMHDAKNALAERIAALPKEGFSISGKTHDGRLLTINASAQQPGAWQLTRFAKDGDPWGDVQYVNKKAAVKEFLDDIDMKTLSRLELD